MITAEIPIEMTGSWFFALDEFDTLYHSTEVEIDPADYPGLVEAWFEVIISLWAPYDPYTGPNQHLYVVDEDGNIAADLVLDLSPSAPGDGEYVRLRTSANLSPFKKKYCLMVPGMSYDLDLGYDFRVARIILKVVDSNRIRVQIPLVHGDGSSAGGGDTSEDNDFWAWGQFTAHPDYLYEWWDGTGGYWWNLFLKTEANWQTVDHWTLEVIGCLAYSPYYFAPYEPITQGPMRAALFNKTTGLMVSGTEIVFSETDQIPRRKTIDFANNAVNFTDGDEFELRIKLDGGMDGDGWPTADDNVGLLYRADLYCTLQPVTRIEVYMAFGSVIEGFATYYSYDDESRWYFERNLFPAGVEFFLETTFGDYEHTPRMRVRSAEVTLVDGNRYIASLFRVGPTQYLCLHNGYLADYGQMEWGRSATTATVIDNGHLSDPGGVIPAITKGWLDGTWQDWLDYHGFYTSWDNKIPAIQLNVAGDTAIVELGGFGFETVIPDGANIQSIAGFSVFGCIGPPQWVDDFVPSLGSGVPVNAYVDMGAFVDGIQQGGWVSATCSNYFLLNPGWAHFDLFYPQVMYAQPAPVFIPISGGASLSLKEYGSTWTKAMLTDARFTIRVRARMPSANRLLQWFFCYADASVGVGTDFLCLSSTSYSHGMSFIIAVVEGQVSPECLWVTATINGSTMVITGTGLGANATEWRVVRTSDDAVMASGVGLNAVFSFVGELNVQYQLQYRYWV